MFQTYIEMSEEVKAAQANHQPILALESTLITHGLPYPENINIAREVEAIARAAKVTPATIAIMNGKIKVGLEEKDLEQLVAEQNCAKSSTRDIAYLLAKKLSAGTTVAATAFCAHLAGIKVFSTGGIGGVHRGDEADISADLVELTRTPIAVVCSGAKAILDLAKTLEFLETFSISIVGYKTMHLPAFYTAKTNYPLPAHFEDMDNLVNYLNINWQLTPNQGVLVANPIHEADEIPAEIIEPVIKQALALSKEKNITGKAVTPFLLGKIREMTQDKSLKANLSLIKNNVTVGAQLAYTLNKIING